VPSIAAMLEPRIAATSVARCTPVTRADCSPAQARARRYQESLCSSELWSRLPNSRSAQIGQ
jgi:hypothetical protein